MKYIILFFISTCLNIYAGEGSGTLPVELVYFNGEVLEGEQSVLLTFGTATETNNYGFNIERADSGLEFVVIDFVPGSGNSSSPKNYSYTDTSVSMNGMYYYRLNQLDITGDSHYSDTVEVHVDFVTSVEDLQIINNFELFQNYPNPFNPTTTIKFTIPASLPLGGIEGGLDRQGEVITLQVFDILGREAATLVNEEKAPGTYEVQFSASGLASGIYYYTLRMGNFISTKSLILLK